MPKTLARGWLWLVVALAACGRTSPNGLPATPTPPAATVTPLAALPSGDATLAPSSEPATSAPATPTSLAEGLTVRLTTPDPSPNCPDHYPWFFENPAQECAATLLHNWSVMQPFEHGLMLWTQEGGRTYVLVDDGSAFKPVQIVSDPQGLPFPGPDPSIVPPEGLFQPELGFALFWRSVVPGHEWVRERLGWATAPETAYPGFWQCNTADGNAARCYINGPRDEILVFAGGAPYWNYVQTAVR